MTVASRPEHPAAHWHLAELLAARNDVSRAQDSYGQAVSLAPAYATPYNNAGPCLEAANELAACWRLHIDVGGFEADEASTGSASQAGGLRRRWGDQLTSSLPLHSSARAQVPTKVFVYFVT